MNRRVLWLAVLIAALAGCSSNNSTPVAQASTILVTSAKTSVLANGTNSVQIHFEGAAKAPVTIQTQRGLFGFSTSVQVDATAGDVLLVTCDATADASCAGDDTIVVTDSALNTGRTLVKFLGLEGCATDCGFDAACTHHSCTSSTGAQGTCSATSPSACVTAVCTSTQAVETSCSDGLDNDCNGLIDCADSACDGQPCKAGQTDWACKSKVCTQTTPTAGVSYGLQVAPARTRIPANGALVPVKITVVAGTTPAAGMALTVTASTGSGVAQASTAAPASQMTATTGTDGTVTVWFTGPTKPGVATITAALTSLPSVSLSASMTAPALGSLAFGGKTFAVMGVKTSGYQETNPISVEVLDDEGKPYPDGLVVTFQHVPLAGSTLTPGDPTQACTTTQGTVSCPIPTASPSDKPDSAGLSAVTLNPGTASGTLVVTASAVVNGVTKFFTFPGIPVVGAKASASNFSVVCSPRNVPALADTDCHTSNVDAHFTCKAILKDRFGNLLGIPTPVTFYAEAGATGAATAITPALDPTKDPTSQTDLGSAVQIFNTLGGPLPKDVDPVAGEPWVVWPANTDTCDPTPATPSVIHNPRDGVVTIVAVADGEDAFTDVNGNGIYDSGEPFITQGDAFIDANDNGVRDADELFFNGGGAYVPPSPTATWRSSAKIWTQTVVVFTGQPMTIATGNPTSYVGTRWAGNDYVGSCQPTLPASFAVNAAKTGTPPIPATSQSFAVVASDGNLNRLASGATYAVEVVKPATVTATYNGLASYADDLGFFFRYWPCDKTGGNCANHCVATAANLPCMMQPSVLAYSCGIAATTTITGGTQPDGGTDVVDWDVSLPYPVYSSSTVTVIDKIGISGTSR